MLRFLRQYNKWILVVGGVLLLITFLVPQAITGLAERSGQGGGTWGRIGDTKIKAAEVQQLLAEMSVLDTLGEAMFPVPGAGKDPVHYLLLLHEARAAGLVGGRDDGLRTADVMARNSGDPAVTVDTVLAMLQSRSGQPRGVILDALANVNGIQRLVSLYETTPRLSDRRLQQAASSMLSAVDADLVVLDARVLSATLVDFVPTEEALQAHLDTYGEFPPPTAAPLGAEPENAFGYRLPNRLKLEWLVIPADQIRRSVESSEQLSNIELRKHRDRNPDLFPRPSDGTDNFDAIREIVRDSRLTQLVTERTDEVAKFASDQLQLPLRGLPRKGTYVTLPDDWMQRQPGFEALGEALAQQFGMGIPTYMTSGPDWIEPTAIDSLQFLGTASSDRFGPRPVRASQLAAQAKEFAGQDTYSTQQGVASPPLRTPAGDVVFFRILETDPARKPASIDEVRTRLVADLRTVEMYRRLTEELEALRSRAATEGLLAVASAKNVGVLPVVDLRERDPRFLAAGFKIPPSIPGLGASEAAATEIVQFAMKLPRESSMTSIPEADRTFAITVDDKFAVIIGRVTDLTPLTIEEYDSLASQGTVERELLNNELRTMRTDLFSREALVARNNFELSRDETELAEESTPGSTPAPAPAPAPMG